MRISKFMKKREDMQLVTSDVEKQASQLASDVRYKAKGKVKPAGASEEEKRKIFITDTWCITST